MRLAGCLLLALASFLGVAGVSLAQAGAPQQAASPNKANSNLPSGAGKDKFVQICSGCHLTTVVTVQRKSEDDWISVVQEMRSRGANGSDEDFEQIVGYLVTNFGLTSVAERVNINTAPTDKIATVLALKSSDAEAIVAYRTKNGAFKDLHGLMQVPGIELAKIEAAKDRIDF